MLWGVPDWRCPCALLDGLGDLRVAAKFEAVGDVARVAIVLAHLGSGTNPAVPSTAWVFDDPCVVESRNLGVEYGVSPHLAKFVVTRVVGSAGVEIDAGLRLTGFRLCVASDFIDLLVASVCVNPTFDDLDAL